MVHSRRTDVADEALPDLNPYRILGVTLQSGEAEIKQAYLQKVRAHPPERDPKAFRRIRAAFEQLRSPQRAELTLSLFRDDFVAVPLDQVREFEPGTPLYTQQDVLWDLLEIELAGIIGLEESWGNEGDTG